MKKFWFWVRLGLSATLVAILLFGADFKDFGSHMSRLNPGFFLIAFILAMGDRVIMAYKWNVLLRVKSIHVSLLNLTGIYLTSTFLGLFLPATVGGDAVRAFAISKGGHKGGDVVSSIVIERLLGIFALMVFMLASIGISIYVFGQTFFAIVSRLFWIGLLISVIFVFLALISINKKALQGGLGWISRRNQKLSNHKLVQKLKEVYQSYLSFQDNKGALVWFLLLSFVENLFPILSSYYISRSFGFDVPLLYFFILIPIVLVLVRLPISIDGIGLQEGAFVYFFTLMGMPHSDALFLGIVTHVTSVISTLPGGVIYVFSGLSLPSKTNQDQGEKAGRVRQEGNEILAKD